MKNFVYAISREKSTIELSAKTKKKSWERTENELGMREIVLDIPNDAEY